MKPLFSIVIPTYNRSHTLGGAIDSCLRQTVTSLEVLVVDDGSSDSTQEVVASYSLDSRVRYFLIENGGAANARNFGVRNARGTYIAFLDSDDIFRPFKLETFLRYRSFLDDGWLLYSQAELVGHTSRRVVPTSAFMNGEDIYRYMILEDGFVPTPTMVLCRDLALSCQWDASLAYGDDTDFVARLCLSGVKLKMIPEPLSVVNDRDRKDRLSLQKDMERVIRWEEVHRAAMTPSIYLAFRVRHSAFVDFWNKPGVYTRLFVDALVNSDIPIAFSLKYFLRAVLPRGLYRALVELKGSS